MSKTRAEILESAIDTCEGLIISGLSEIINKIFWKDIFSSRITPEMKSGIITAVMSYMENYSTGDEDPFGSYTYTKFGDEECVNKLVLEIRKHLGWE